MRGRMTAKRVAWCLAAFAVVALAVNGVGATRKRGGGASTVTVDFWADANGTAILNTIDPPIRPKLANVIFTVQEHNSALGEDLWQSADWSIDIQPVSSPITPLQRRQIIDQMFAGWTTFIYLKGKTPLQALSAVPAPGTTVVSGSEFVLHRWGFVSGVVAGWPIGFALLAAAVGVTVLLEPKAVDRSVCGACGYSRAGLARGTPCPECGLGRRDV